MSSKTQIYFSTAVAKWDADFYIKVDDDVHVNLGECILHLNASAHYLEKSVNRFDFKVFELVSTLNRHGWFYFGPS